MNDATSTHQGKNEIIIVKRRHGDDDDGAHGGVWKIAYADFMTAMMAFFLVMWLVNAANEETKVSVASYFNPIKLMDDRPTERGIKEVGDSAEGEASAPKSEADGDVTSDGQDGESGDKANTTIGEKKDYSEADYFENPYSVLAEIALETGTQTNVSAKGDGGAAQSGPATGASGGEAYRDPFDPDFWSQQLEQQRVSLEQAQPLVQAEANPEKPAPADAGPEAGLTQAEAAAKRVEADVLKDEIAQALGGAVGKLAEGLTVTPAEGGLLVSITDQLDFGMFNVGSAVPARDLVVAMEKIGKILAERPGAIAIRGHTDARPFSAGDDDNWRLSMARAHSALFMLVRGGVPEDRVVQVSGFADRRLKDPENPFSEVNRRIEILVEAGGS